MAKKIAVKNKISLGKVTIDGLALITAKGFEEVDAKLSDFRTEVKKSFVETVTKTELKTELNNFRTEINQKFATVDGKLTAIIQKLETLDQREEFVLLEKRVCRLEKTMSVGSSTSPN